VPENGLQLFMNIKLRFQLQGRGDSEHASIAIKAAVRHQDVAVGIVCVGTDLKSVPVAEGLDSDDGAGNGIVLWPLSCAFVNRILEKNLQGFPGRAT
jgi:hypothetical protein